MSKVTDPEAICADSDSTACNGHSLSADEPAEWISGAQWADELDVPPETPIARVVGTETWKAVRAFNRKYGIEELLSACAAYPGASNARRITFEYVMLKDKNDSDDDARELVRLIKQYKLPAKVNLIPFNPWPGAIYECSTPERVRRFSDIVFEAGISAPVRTPRGRDIDAACGQLKTAAEKKSRAQRDREAAAALD